MHLDSLLKIQYSGLSGQLASQLPPEQRIPFIMTILSTTCHIHGSTSSPQDVEGFSGFRCCDFLSRRVVNLKCMEGVYIEYTAAFFFDQVHEVVEQLSLPKKPPCNKWMTMYWGDLDCWQTYCCCWYRYPYPRHNQLTHSEYTSKSNHRPDLKNKMTMKDVDDSLWQVLATTPAHVMQEVSTSYIEVS